jgi:hypothetical protein
MFQLTENEVSELNRSQFVTGSQKHRDPRFRPYASTEQGVAMLSSVLRSKTGHHGQCGEYANLSETTTALDFQHQIARKLADLEKKYDHQFKVVLEAIRKLMTPAVRNKQEIGFRPKVLPK